MAGSSRNPPHRSLYRILAVRPLAIADSATAGTRITEAIETVDNDAAVVMLYGVDGRDVG